MDKSYQDGNAMLLLAQSYEKKGEKDKANIQYQKIVEEFKDTNAAGTAQKALDSQKPAESQDGDGQQDAAGDSGGSQDTDDEQSSDDEEQE